MAVKNCARCGRLFSGIDDVCPVCREQEQAEFERVKAYLTEKPGAAVAEVSAQTGVAVAQIHRWVRAGRLKLTQEQLGGSLRCQRCGAPIDHGRFCPSCVEQLSRELSRAAAPPRAEGEPERPGPAGGVRKARVHTRDDVKRRFG